MRGRGLVIRVDQRLMHALIGIYKMVKYLKSALSLQLEMVSGHLFSRCGSYRTFCTLSRLKLHSWKGTRGAKLLPAQHASSTNNTFSLFVSVTPLMGVTRIQ